MRVVSSWCATALCKRPRGVLYGMAMEVQHGGAAGRGGRQPHARAGISRQRVEFATSRDTEIRKASIVVEGICSDMSGIQSRVRS